MRSKKVEPGVGGTKATLDLNQSFDEMDSEDERERETMLQELLHEIKDEDDRELVEEMKAIGLDQWEKPWISVSIENYENQFFRYDFMHIHVYLYRVSFLTTLDIYKDYFKGCHTRCKVIVTCIL